MNERPTDEELQALLADAAETPLGTDEEAEIGLLTDLLGDPATWAEPPPGLKGSVLQAVADAPIAPAEPVQPTRRSHRTLYALVAAAAAIVVVVVGLLVAVSSTTSPDYSGQLRATALAPGASGSADVTRNDAGFRIVVDAHGLQQLPAGQYYQAWLKNAGGTLVPIGTFSSSDGKVTLWSGVDPKEFPTLTVTIENADNQQASSGKRVLVGEVHAR